MGHINRVMPWVFRAKHATCSSGCINLRFDHRLHRRAAFFYRALWFQAREDAELPKAQLPTRRFTCLPVSQALCVLGSGHFGTVWKVEAFAGTQRGAWCVSCVAPGARPAVRAQGQSLSFKPNLPEVRLECSIALSISSPSSGILMCIEKCLDLSTGQTGPFEAPT